MKNESFDRMISMALLAIAVACLALVFRRNFAQPAESGAMPKRAVRKIENWSVVSMNAVRPLVLVPNPRARVTVFTDFECPFCSRLDSLLNDYNRKNAGVIQLQIAHMPLSMHINAKPAAQAFECAFEQGRASMAVRALYQHQNVLGQIPWDSIAALAVVPSLQRFHACMLDSMPESINAGKLLAKDLNLSVTPTVVVNDWLVSPADPEFICVR